MKVSKLGILTCFIMHVTEFPPHFRSFVFYMNLAAKGQR